MTALFHVSEEAGIRQFEPRPDPKSAQPLVWAISEARLCNYLVPRDCPRVTFYADEGSTDADIRELLAGADKVVAVEEGWMDRIRTARLYIYEMPPATFSLSDDNAGYYVSPSPVIPAGCRTVGDLPAALAATGATLRVLPMLWQLNDRIVRSSLRFSMIRMRNALPREPTVA